MKRLFYLWALLIGFISISSALSQNGWQWKNPLPQGNDLQAVFFVSDSIGWCAGDHGTILKTYDGGITWQYQQVTINNQLKKIYFLDENNGWIVGGSGVILHTTNGGNQWNLVNLGISQDLNDIIFTTSSIGWIVGNSGTLLKTNDGGNTWQTVNLGNVWDYLAIDFVGSSEGWILLSSFYYYTNDGGNTWTPSYNAPISSAKEIDFFDSNNGWIGGLSSIVYTHSGGNIWSFNYISSNAINSIDPINADTLFIAAGGSILKSEDGGANWNITYTASNSINSFTTVVYDLFFLNDTLGWGVGSHGLILKTTDGGLSWSLKSSSFLLGYDNHILDINFINDTIGWLCGNSTLMKTENGGNTWNSISLPSYYNNIKKSFFLNADTGWVIAHKSVFRTSNGGITWNHDSVNTGHDLTSIYFINKNIGWVVGDYDKIFKSNDGGATWTTISTGTSGVLFYDIFFLNELNGWAVGANGTLLKTTDGGSSWQTITSGTSAMLKKVFFTSANTGYILSALELLKTTDSGITWIPTFYSPGNNLYLNDFEFINDSIGWIVGVSDTVYLTRDGGATWTTQETPTYNDFSTISAIDSLHLYIGGNYGTILYTQQGGDNCPDLISQVQITPVSCYGYSDGAIEITTLSSFSFYSYQWNTGATSSSITGLSAGIYNITVNSSGCQTVKSLTIEEPLPFSIYASTQNVSIPNGNDGSISLLVNGGTYPYYFYWNTGNTTSTISGLSSGIYSVTINDNNSCEKTENYTITAPPCQISISISSTDATNDNPYNGTAAVTVTGSANNFYFSWSNGDTLQTISGLAPGTYTITVTDEYGCFISDSVVIAINMISSSITPNKNTSIINYPNPTYSIITLSNLKANDLIQIKSITGQIIFSKQVHKNTIKIKLSKYESGIYILNVYRNQQLIYENKIFKIKN